MTNLSKALDQYFTPPRLAQSLIEAVTLVNPTSVMDFAAGDGELLRAALTKWPEVICNAVDIDARVVGLLKSNHPEWNIDRCDFTSSKARKSAKILKENNTFPLVILNPPFSWKGKTLQRVEIGGISTRCSPALAFVITAASYLEEGGQLVAIVPYGLVYNERDRVALDLLKSHFFFEVVKVYNNGGFVNCSPRTAIIRLTASCSSLDRDNTEVINSVEVENFLDITVSVKRGRVQDNLIKGIGGEVPFIHTTNLKENKITNLSRYVGDNYAAFKGPGVLMPRVGRPSIKKVILLGNEDIFVMSECLFLLECNTLLEAEAIYSCVLENWNYLTERQGGTCASFLSVQTMIDCLNKFGFNVLANGESVRVNETTTKLSERAINNQIIFDF